MFRENAILTIFHLEQEKNNETPIADRDLLCEGWVWPEGQTLEGDGGTRLPAVTAQRSPWLC